VVTINGKGIPHITHCARKPSCRRGGGNTATTEPPREEALGRARRRALTVDGITRARVVKQTTRTRVRQCSEQPGSGASLQAEREGEQSRERAAGAA
jgi:hypothetical protein